MERRGIQTHVRKLTGKQIVIDRFRDLATLLDDIDPDTWIVFPDVGDIVFQYNPRHYLESVSKDIVVTHEGVLFSGNKWMLNNLYESFPKYAEGLKDKFFFNAGSIAAKAGILSQMSEHIYKLCLENQNATSHDQTAMNILLHNNPVYRKKTLFLSPNDPWCFCGASSIFARPEDAKNYLSDPVTVQNGICYSRPNVKTCMFHHYTRNKNIARQVITQVNRRFVNSRR